jgi:glycosyltransferase involved in cell wall biosynthesis
MNNFSKSRMIKVINIIGSIDKSIGGPARSVTQACKFVSKKGIKIDLITRKSDNPVSIVQTNIFKLKYHSLLSLVNYGIFNINKHNDQLIHLQHIWDPYIHIMAVIARWKGIPYILSTRGMMEPWILNRNRWKKKLGLALYQNNDIKKAKCIHVTSEIEKIHSIQLGYNNPIAQIPNGLDTSHIFGLKPNYQNKKVVFLSRIHTKKGIEILLDAWKVANLSDWTLEIAGDGEKRYIKKINDKIKNDHISKVRFLGPKYGDEKWRFLRSGSIFILPSYSENFGMVIAEALALGLPVITTKNTPWKEIKEYKCGWWIKLNLNELINILHTATQCNCHELQLMGIRGKKLIQEKYSIQIVAEKMSHLYYHFCKNGEKPKFLI